MTETDWSNPEVRLIAIGELQRRAYNQGIEDVEKAIQEDMGVENCWCLGTLLRTIASLKKPTNGNEEDAGT